MNRPAQEPLTPSPLTEREMEILQLLAQGVENKEIALKLFVRDATVRTHVSNILGQTATGEPRPGHAVRAEDGAGVTG